MICEITPEIVSKFEAKLQSEAIQIATRSKYIHDLVVFQEYLHGEELTQEKLDIYPEWLIQNKGYAKNSVNTAIVSIKKFLMIMGWNEFRTKSCFISSQERKQLKKFVSKDDYLKLIQGAVKFKKRWMAVLLQTLCHMDIRYIELFNLTVESLKKGFVEVVRSENPIRFDIPDGLSEVLEEYVDREKIRTGIIFRTAQGNFLNRSYVWRELKSLCRKLGMNEVEYSLVHFKKPAVEGYYPYCNIYENAELGD